MAGVSTLARDFGFDPRRDTATALKVNFRNAMVGITPTGFVKVRVEMTPKQLLKLVGYDPRSLQPVKRGQKVISASRHVAQVLVDLQREIQRSIDPKKVAEMVQYLHEAASEGHYGDWAELDAVTTAIPDLSAYSADHVVYFPEDANYIVIDGQHRHCALIDFTREYPALAEHFTQGLAISVLTEAQLHDFAGQGFHDKNFLRTAVKATKALAVDHRDPHNVLARELYQHPVIVAGGGVNETKDQLGSTSEEMITHSTLYKFVRGFCEGRRGIDKGRLDKPALTEGNVEEHRKTLADFLTRLGDVLPTWTNKEKRGDYLFRSGSAWQALGVLGHAIYELDEENERVAALARIGEKKLDWKRTNLEWEGVMGAKQTETDAKTKKVTKEYITPRASRQSVDSTIAFLKKHAKVEIETETNGTKDSKK